MDNGGEIKEWRLITAKGELHDILAQQNLKHLHQASATPIDHGDGYSLFNEPERHETAKSVLEGTLEWEHPVAEVNEFIANMRIAHNLTALKEEMDKINADVIAAEYRHYFKHKDESVELSPSGRHMGHYKAILGCN